MALVPVEQEKTGDDEPYYDWSVTDDGSEEGETETPLCDVLFKNTPDKRLHPWVRRFARELQTETAVGDGDDIGDVRALLEEHLAALCESEWEMANLTQQLQNDGSVEGMTAVLKMLTARKTRKEEKRHGGSRYGPLAIQLNNQAAIRHKRACEPGAIFRASSAQLQPLWTFFRPKPRSRRCRPGCEWELRLTTRPWVTDEDEQDLFVLVRRERRAGGEGGGPKNNPRASGEELRGFWQWDSTLVNGETFSDSVLTLTLPTAGNTDRHDGKSSSLTVVYARDADRRGELNYQSHEYGRTSTSEMVSVDERFPPRFFEGEVEELSDDEAGELIKMSLERLARAKAGVQETHEAHLPPKRRIK